MAVAINSTDRQCTKACEANLNQLILLMYANWQTIEFLIMSLARAVVCTAVVSPMFSMPVYQPIIAVILAMLVAVLAVRALGETDLNPVSGVGKVSQVMP